MILLTGASGFVGRHVGTALLKSDSEVLLMSRRPQPQHVVGNLTDDSLNDLPWDRVTRVIHCASAIPGKADDYVAVNIKGTQRLLEKLSPTNLRSFVLLSSLSVYGVDLEAKEVEFTEDGKTDTKNPYGLSKIRQEQLVHEFCGEMVPCTTFRPSSIFGKGNTSRTVLPIFCDKASRDEPIILTGPKNYLQNFVSVSDVTTLVVEASKHANCGTYNLFSPLTLSIIQLAERIIAALGSCSKISDLRCDDPYPKIKFDADRLTEAFDHPFTDFEEAIRLSC